MAVVTSSVPEHCRTALTHLDLMKYFEGVTLAHDLGLEKKDPALWRAAAEHYGVAPEDCGTAFPCAVALLAAADLWSCRCGTDTVTSFTAGDLSIQGKDAEKAKAVAQSMRETARTMMAPYTTDGAFCFRGVQG